MIETLGALGSTNVWAVRGKDGLDEITTTTETEIIELKNGSLHRFTLTPEDAGLTRAKPESLRGGDADENARALTAVLNGEKTAYRDIAILNSAAALVVADKAETIKDAVQIAAKAVDSGAAKDVLARLVAVSNA
jgi:anthranilate phosphoribosyltransferase